MANSGPFGRLFGEFKDGGITRRQFLQRAATLGVGLPVATFVANSVPAAGAPARPNAGWATVHQDATAGAPAAGLDGKTRGQGGEVKILQWQAPTHANPHLASGSKDYLAATPVLEPLLSYLPDGTIIPTLAAQVPTVDNGQLAPDLTSVTFSLKPGVLWSDGTPFTAEDPIFTWQWILDSANGSVSTQVWAIIASAEALDELTVKFTFTKPTATWYEPFTGTTYGFILPKHALEAGADAANAFLTNPIGTGPYVVKEFKVNDQVIYEPNPNYREPNKPFFQTVNLKGGGDPASAARAVFQTGDWDYGWNLQVEPEVLNEIMASGDKGVLLTAKGISLERIAINFSDPNREVNGERSQKDTPHPFFSDPAVRQALNVAVDRQTIATQFYGEGEPPTANIVTGLPAFESPNTSFEYNLDDARQILDAAGWVLDGDIRKKGDVELKITYATTINPVRQKTQAVVKKAFEDIGVQVSLEQVDSGIFFDSSPGNEQNYTHFYTDVNMYTDGAVTPLPISYMTLWYAGPNGENIAQKANNWGGQNINRWANADYDALYDQLLSVTDMEQATELLIQMNDIVINDVVIIPQVNRAASKNAASKRLLADNIALGAFETSYWNIANWVTVE